jgi:hypothetical protein
MGPFDLCYSHGLCATFEIDLAERSGCFSEASDVCFCGRLGEPSLPLTPKREQASPECGIAKSHRRAMASKWKTNDLGI